MYQTTDYIQLANNDYGVRIMLENITAQDALETMIQIENGNYRWSVFNVNDEFWYRDGSKYLTCLFVNHDDEMIVFG